MAQRFFMGESIEEGLVELSGAEAQHLGRVMRAQPGDEVLLFDGQGREAVAIIQQVERDRIVLESARPQDVDRELPFSLVLGVALPRGDRQKWLVEKLVELGVGSLVPLVTDRGVAQPVPKAIERLKRMVIEASKQSGRNRLMEIESPCSLAQFLQRESESSVCIIADPHPTAPAIDPLAIREMAKGRIVAAVGPEGGFSPEEMEQADQFGWQRRRLGNRILRIETAAMALAAVLGQGIEGEK